MLRKRIGYGKEFYDAIPCDKETLVIDKSFLQLQRLHTGFTFKLLRNTSECFRAGRELNNCLQSWESFGSPVITVSQANEIVAAIEISDNTVTQAYSYENLSIDHVFGLSAAIEKWAKQNKITFSK